MLSKYSNSLVAFIFTLALVCVFSAVSSHTNEAYLNNDATTFKTLYSEEHPRESLNILVLSVSTASQFIHEAQRNIEYVYSLVLALFSAFSACIFKEFSVLRAPPWFLSISTSCRSKVSGWKESNLLYKAQLTYHH